MRKSLLLLFALFVTVFAVGQKLSVFSTGNMTDEGTPPAFYQGGETDYMGAYVIPGLGATSGNTRIPGNNFLYQETTYLITAAEMAASGFPTNVTVDDIGWWVQTAGVGTLTGTLEIWMMNTNDATWQLSTTAFTTAGFTKVHSAPFTVPIAAGEYTVSFTGGSPFTYTGAGVYVAWQFSAPGGTVGTALLANCNNATAGLLYGGRNGTGFPTTNWATSAFRPATKFGNVSLTDILAVGSIWALEKTPVPYGVPVPVKGRIVNSTASAATCDVTVTIKDATNTTTRYTATQTGVSIPANSETVVTFNWTPTIQEDIKITVTCTAAPGETYTVNNTKTIDGQVNGNLFGYTFNFANATNAVGFTSPSNSGIFACRYEMQTPGTIPGANILIGNNANNVGQTVYAAVLDKTGMIVAQSAPLVLQTTDLGVVHNFTFPTPPDIAPEEFYVGLAVTPSINATSYYAIAVFDETPARPNAYYSFGITGSPPAEDSWKWAIEAQVAPFTGVVYPRNFTATPAGLSQINLSWLLNLNGDNVMVAYNTTNTFGTPANGTSYPVSSTIPGGGTVIFNAGGASFNHTGLNPGTTYYYMAWSVDGAVNYSVGKPATAATFYNIPYTQDFEVTTILPVSWAGKMEVTPLHGTGGSSGLTFDVWDGGAGYEYYLDCDAISPTIVLSANTCKVSFDYRVTEWVSSGYPGAATVFTTGDKIEVQISTNGGTTWTVLYTIDQTNHVNSQNFANKSVLLTGYTGPVKIRLYAEGHDGCDQYLDIDNFVVEEGPLCDPPTGLTASSSSINSAVIGWTTPTVVILDYGAPGHAAGTGTIINPVTTNPYTLTGLAAGTSYDVWIRQECSPGVFSPWVGPASFSTLPILQITPKPFDFGNAAQGGQSASQSFAIKNNGTSPILIDVIDLTGTDANQFILTGGVTNYNLAGGATYNVGIVFAPTSAGLKSANLRVSENETDHLCPISGTGICAAAAAPFSEGFEQTTFPPTCWSESTGTQLWQGVDACSGYGVGTYSALAWFYNYPSTTPFHLMTLPFSLTGVNNPVLKFDYAYATYSGEVDQLDIYYSTDFGNNWTLLQAMPGGTSGILNTGGVSSAQFIPNAGQWATHTINLPAGANMVRFTAISAYGNNLFLDNVRVEAGLPTNYSASGTYNDGMAHCFNASNTITVSNFTATGTGTNIEFIAGQNILFQPPVLINQSATMWAHITTTNTYCGSSDAPMVAAVQQAEPLTTIEQPRFSLFPNPTSGNITVVQKNGPVFGDLKVEIFSMRGERVIQSLMIGEKQHEFNTSALPTGLYFVKLTGSDFTQTIKLVKTR